MKQAEYHDSDFSMRARFYLETKCHKEARKTKNNGRRANRVVKTQVSGKRRGK